MKRLPLDGTWQLAFFPEGAQRPASPADAFHSRDAERVPRILAIFDDLGTAPLTRPLLAWSLARQGEVAPPVDAQSREPV